MAFGDEPSTRVTFKQFILTKGLGLTAAEATELAKRSGFRSASTGSVYAVRAEAKKEKINFEQRTRMHQYVLSRPATIDPEKLAYSGRKIGYSHLTKKGVQQIRALAGQKPKDSLTALIESLPDDMPIGKVIERAIEEGFKAPTAATVGTLRWQKRKAAAIAEGKAAAIAEAKQRESQPAPELTLETLERELREVAQRSQRTSSADELETALRPPSSPPPSEPNLTLHELHEAQLHRTAIADVRAEFNRLLTRVGTDRARLWVAEYEVQQLARAEQLQDFHADV